MAGCPFGRFSGSKRSSSICLVARAGPSTSESVAPGWARRLAATRLNLLLCNAFWLSATGGWRYGVTGAMPESEICFGLQGWADAEFRD